MATAPHPADDPDRRAMEALAAPIPEHLIRTRAAPGGRQLRYIQAPTVIAQLDAALGPANWETETEMGPDWVRCRLTITLPSGKRVARDGIGGYPEMPAAEDRVKGAASDAFKRAGALFHIGLHLYDDAGPDQGGGPAPAGRSQPPQRGTWGGSQPPPPRAGGNGHDRHREPEPAPQGGGGPEFRGRNGRALFAWAKEHDLVGTINAIGKQYNHPGRMIDWTEDQVMRAYSTYSGAAPAEEEYVPDEGPTF